jgi:hypothetical protein
MNDNESLFSEKREFQKAAFELLTSFSVSDLDSINVEASQDYFGFLANVNNLFNDLREKEKKISNQLNRKIKSLEIKLDQSVVLRDVGEKRYQVLEENYQELKNVFQNNQGKSQEAGNFEGEKFARFWEEVKACERKRDSIKNVISYYQSKASSTAKSHLTLQKV